MEKFTKLLFRRYLGSVWIGDKLAYSGTILILHI